MKTITALLLAALLCGSAFAESLDTVVASSVRDWEPQVMKAANKSKKPGNVLPEFQAIYDKIAGTDKVITQRELLAAYATGEAKVTALMLDWIKTSKQAPAILSALEAEVSAMTKAGNPQATTVRRAIEKFTRQLSDNGALPDAKAAMADALKALEKK